MIQKRTAVISCIVVCIASLLVCTLVFTGVARLYLINQSTKGLGFVGVDGVDGSMDYSRLEEIRRILQKNALWNPSDERLLNQAASAMAYGEQDRYARYYTKEEYEAFVSDAQGEYVGIGAAVNTDAQDGYVTIVHVYRDSPAQIGGLRMQDKILAVDDQDVLGMTPSEVANLARGESGTQVKITVGRGTEVLDFVLTRQAVISDRVEWHMIDETIGFIRIYEFQGNAVEFFERAVAELLNEGMSGLVLDLRSNPGGDYDAVVQIADRLLPKGEIITLMSRDGEVLDRRMSDENMLGLPMVVLVNEYSASASELLAGDVKDYEVGVLVGKTTYGKGVGQVFNSFDDGAVICYTAFEYLTGKGNCPQDVGVKPDIVVEQDEEVLRNSLLLCTERDVQYVKALEVLRDLMQAAQLQPAA